MRAEKQSGERRKRIKEYKRKAWCGWRPGKERMLEDILKN